VKTNRGKKVLKLGDLVESGYRACGKGRTIGILRLAAKVRLIVSPGRGPFIIS
jgi:hypothetical protein